MLPNSLKGGKTVLASAFLSQHPVTVCPGLKFKKRTSVPYLSCQIPPTNSGICTASLASAAPILKIPFWILLARIVPAGNSTLSPRLVFRSSLGRNLMRIPQEDLRKQDQEREETQLTSQVILQKAQQPCYPFRAVSNRDKQARHFSPLNNMLLNV